MLGLSATFEIPVLEGVFGVAWHIRQSLRLALLMSKSNKPFSVFKKLTFSPDVEEDEAEVVVEDTVDMEAEMAMVMVLSMATPAAVMEMERLEATEAGAAVEDVDFDNEPRCGGKHASACEGWCFLG